MQANMDERLERAVATLSGLIELMHAKGLVDSALFLEMAKLQVQLDVHGITDGEFGAFCDALERGALASSTLARPGQPRARHLRGQGRAWQCANGIAVRRAGRRRAKH